MNKTLNISKFFHEVHGDKPTIPGLIMTYSVGLMAGIVSCIMFYGNGFEMWRALLVGIIFFDVAGGVVSNLTKSTNSYYQRSEKRRIVFLLLHVLQPLLLALLIGGHWAYLIFVAAYTVIGGLVVNSARSTDRQNTAAAALVTIGMIALTMFNVNHEILYAFSALFMVKILIGFAVKRS